MGFDPQYLESYVSVPHRVGLTIGTQKAFCLVGSGSSLPEGYRSEE